MTGTSAPSDGGWSAPTTSGKPRRAAADEEWGPATNVRGGGTSNPPSIEWSPAGPLPSREQRATRRADKAADRAAEPERKSRADRVADARAAAIRERGLPWWGALLVLIAIAAIGGLIDTIGSIQIKGGFNVGIVVASVVAILIVKRSQMFPVVIAPPIVYSVAALFQLYVRSSGLHDKKVVFDAAANYLVYGFPAIAAATAAVLIIAGIRLIIRK